MRCAPRGVTVMDGVEPWDGNNGVHNRSGSRPQLKSIAGENQLCPFKNSLPRAEARGHLMPSRVADCNIGIRKKLALHALRKQRCDGT